LSEPYPGQTGWNEVEIPIYRGTKRSFFRIYVSFKNKLMLMPGISNIEQGISNVEVRNRFTLSIKIDRIPHFEILRFLILLFCGSSYLLFGI